MSMNTTAGVPRGASDDRVEAEAPSARGRPPTGKPLLRGVSHQIGFFIAIVATFILVAATHTRPGAIAVGTFGTTLVLLLGTSACYHRIEWSPSARARMRRLDHAAIFLLIGGGYTPLFALVPSPSGGHGALVAIWGAAFVGVVKSIAWPHAPKWLTALICVAIGWMVIFEVTGRTPVVGAVAIGLLVASGMTYSVGAVVYALKRPDPLPRIFGYHEIFHLLVCLASGLLFAHVCFVTRAVQG